MILIFVFQQVNISTFLRHFFFGEILFGLFKPLPTSKWAVCLFAIEFFIFGHVCVCTHVVVCVYACSCVCMYIVVCVCACAHVVTGRKTDFSVGPP